MKIITALLSTTILQYSNALDLELDATTANTDCGSRKQWMMDFFEISMERLPNLIE